MAWIYRSGRISELDASEHRCTAVTCGKPASYRIRAVSDLTGEVINAYRCTACAAALHYQKGLPFPPGMWDRPDSQEIPERAAPAAEPVDQVAAEPPAIATLPVPPEVVRPRKRIVFEIPENAPSGLCESCRAKIVWIPSKNGVPMPIEPEGDRRGESHFAHCKYADHHRRRYA